MSTERLYRPLLAATVTLALAVVVLGAYVRLSAAGLGCPDWPGCYGHLTVAAAEARAGDIAARFPAQPLQPAKAHKEMLHRYTAAILGLLVITVAGFAWKRGQGRRLGLLLAGLILFQALLGMWTVTLRLEPLVVAAHLVGGMSVLALLWWLLLDTRPAARMPPNNVAVRLKLFAAVGLLLLAAQILLGGWTSSHYAGLACTGFPMCNGQWWPSADFAAGFGERALDSAGRVAIQWVHRLGALVVLLYLGGLALASHRTAPGTTFALGVLLLLQVVIGAGNVLTGLPLPLAAAHNAVAALLLLTLVTLNHRLARTPGAAMLGERR